MPQFQCWLLRQGLKMALDVLQQGTKRGPLVIVGHLPPRPAPEPLDPVGVRIIGRCIDEAEMLGQLRQHLAHQLRPSWGMGAQVICNDNGQVAPGT